MSSDLGYKVAIVTGLQRQSVLLTLSLRAYASV